MAIDATSFNSQSGVPQGQTTVTKKEETPFSIWTEKVAESVDVIATIDGEPVDVTKLTAEQLEYVEMKTVYKNDVEPFDFGGDEFVNDIKNNGGKKAAEIYLRKAGEVVQGIMTEYDTNGDGVINALEQVQGDLAAYEKKFGPVEDAALKEEMQKTSVRAYAFMDLDRKTNPENKGIDPKELTAFIMGMDSNNKLEEANSKISREEYVKTTGYFEKPIDDESAKFRGFVRGCYRTLYGYDPAAQ